jgi:hypothetical protein
MSPFSESEHRAESLRRLGRPAEAVAEQGRAASMGADPSYIAEVAGDRASEGDWSEAARLSARAVALGADEGAERAVICLRTGDVDGYHRACAAIVAAGPRRRPDDAIAAGWAIGLAPGAVDDYARPLALVDSALARISRLNPPPDKIREMRREAMMVRAGVLLRAGRADEALVELDKAAGLGLSDPFAGLLAAIAHARAGRVAEAKARLDGALAAIAAEPGRPASWPEKAGLAVLQAEAERAVMDCGFPADPFAGP